eukprot:TRINITY_DN7470_c0_g1_i1.p5 TRINITY_DN7470_c0_g1~~TRINITY_DN7470_c0_g1_i1.p5  ORF type:complete len:102 (-),score=6.37 TRINITY_DN7470_c0_g1_i1:425-730(-)
MMQYGTRSMYIRIKRYETTYFVSVDKSWTILEVKQRLQELCEKAPNQLRLVNHSSGEELQDSKKLQELKIESDDVLALCFLREDGSFEEVNIKEYEILDNQ